MIQVQDLRRRIAFRALGAARLLLVAHADLEDARGAVEAEQVEVAVIAGRQAIRRSLSIRSLQTVGELDFASDYLNFDPFAGLDAEEVRSSLELVRRGFDVDSVEAGLAWWQMLRDHLSETERRLGYAEPLLSVRTPGGMFPALRAARQWIELLDELGLPPLLPKEWVSVQESR